MGARTLLVEAAPKLGGTAVRAVLSVLCGVFQQAEESEWLGNGLSMRVGQALQKAGGGAPRRIDEVWVQPVLLEAWESLLLGLLEANQVVVQTGVALDGEAVAALKPGAWVDCSGDGVTGPLLDVRWQQSERPELQVPAVSGIVGPLPEGVLWGARSLLALGRAVDQGRVPLRLKHLRVYPAGERALLKMNMAPPESWDPLDPAVRSALLQEGLACLESGFTVLREAVAGFSGARWIHRPAILGVRESRRLLGRERLELGSVLAGASHPEGVALGAWPVELWPEPDRQEVRRISGESYDVPLGALWSADRDDLFFGGRCVSASHEALGSIRVLGGCLETGQAAGTAAALRALKGRVTAEAIQPWRAWPEL